MNPSIPITIDHVRKALDIIKKGGTEQVKYYQIDFCGTACCLMGHAAIVSGRHTEKEVMEAHWRTRDDIVDQLTKFQVSDSLLERTLAGQMNCTITTPEQFEHTFKLHDKGASQ